MKQKTEKNQGKKRISKKQLEAALPEKDMTRERNNMITNPSKKDLGKKIRQHSETTESSQDSSKKLKKIDSKKKLKKVVDEVLN